MTHLAAILIFSGQVVSGSVQAPPRDRVSPPRTGTGIVFNDFDAPAVKWAIHTALDLYKQTHDWQQIVQNGMRQDFSWEKQGAEYERLYASLVIPA